MGRSFAGVLGSLAFATVLLRGACTMQAAASAIPTALAALVIWSAIGAVLGTLAAWLIDESVRGQLVEQLAAESHSTTNPAATALPRGGTP